MRRKYPDARQVKKVGLRHHIPGSGLGCDGGVGMPAGASDRSWCQRCHRGPEYTDSDFGVQTRERARCHCDSSVLKGFPRVSYLCHHQHQCRHLSGKGQGPRTDCTSLHPYLEVSASHIKDQSHNHLPLPVSLISLLQSRPHPSNSKRIQSYLDFSLATAIDVVWYSLLML